VAKLWRYDSPLLDHLAGHCAAQASSTPDATPPFQRRETPDWTWWPEIQGLEAHAAAPERLSYTELKAAATSAAAQADWQPQLNRRAAERISFLLRSFSRSAAAKERALALHINDSLFSLAAPGFARLVRAALAAAPAAAAALAGLKGDAAAHDVLFAWFADHVAEQYGAEVAAYRDALLSLDLRNPHLWFPMARALQRRVIYHAGPTNSGKTYNALAAMRAAGSGVYCGPLRLLAMEVYDVSARRIVGR